MMAGGGQEGGLRAGTENMTGIAAWGAVMMAEPARPMVFVCCTGHRSPTAAQQLLHHGHTHIHHLTGGLALA